MLSFKHHLRPKSNSVCSEVTSNLSKTVGSAEKFVTISFKSQEYSLCACSMSFPIILIFSLSQNENKQLSAYLVSANMVLDSLN